MPKIIKNPRAVFLLSILIFLSTVSQAAPLADVALPNKPVLAPIIIPPAPDVDAKAYALMDAHTGQLIASRNMDARLAPASLTKLMTLYIASTALVKGQIHLTDQVRVSESAWHTGGSRMFIQVGTTVPVSDLMQGIIVASGNDATVAIAEYLAGSQDSFVPIMNQTALQLGMLNTHYTDATGLPDPAHYMSAHDAAILAREIVNQFPQYYHWYSEKWFVYNGIRQANRNRLLWSDPTVDGIKTGHTDDAGYCLIASAKRNDMRLISVIMGAPTDKARAEDNQELLDYGFRFFHTVTLYKPNTPIANARVWFGDSKTVPVGVMDGVMLTLANNQNKDLLAHITLSNQLKAPIKKGQILGSIKVTIADKVITQLPLVALQDDAKGSIFSRLADHITLLFHKMFHKKSE